MTIDTETVDIEVRPYGVDGEHDELDYIERTERYRGHVHDAHADLYETMLGDGCSPRIAAAALRHAEEMLQGEATQAEVADAYDISHVTTRLRRQEYEPDVFDVLRDGGDDGGE